MVATVEGRVHRSDGRHWSRSCRFRLLSGITRDSTGAALGNVTVQVFETATDRYITEVISDANGVYVIPVGIGTGPYYLVAYIAGAPDRGGTTVNTLVGA